MSRYFVWRTTVHECSPIFGFVGFLVEEAHPHLNDPVPLVHVPHALQLHHILFQSVYSMRQEGHVLLQRICPSSRRVSMLA